MVRVTLSTAEDDFRPRLWRWAQGHCGAETRPSPGATSSPATPTNRSTLRYTYRNITSHTMADSDSRFGFVNFAETWNGRLAMLGFVIGLGTELLTGQGILTQIGLG